MSDQVIVSTQRKRRADSVQLRINISSELHEKLMQIQHNEKSKSLAALMRKALWHYVDNHEQIVANRRFFTKRLEARFDRLEQQYRWSMVFVVFLLLEIGLSLLNGLFPDEHRKAEPMLRDITRLASARGGTLLAFIDEVVEAHVPFED